MQAPKNRFPINDLNMPEVHISGVVGPAPLTAIVWWNFLTISDSDGA
jgi:hypothetical protein